MKCLGSLLMILCLATLAPAETFKVFPDGSGDYPDIQSAVHASSDGDTVLLADGLYTGAGNRDVFFGSRWILVRSESLDPELCVIDCQGSAGDMHMGFYIDITGSKTPPPRTTQGLRGLTVTNGYAHSGAALITSDGACPQITRCNFIGNTAQDEGGVLNCSEAGAQFCDCLFLDNSARWGGVFGLSYYGSSTALNCTFAGNTAQLGGVAAARRANWLFSMTGCTFVDNHATQGSHFYLTDDSWLELERCILAFGSGYDAVFCTDSSDASLLCCDIFGNEHGDWTGAIADQCGLDGNISEDPLFCDAAAGNYALYDVSPCRPFSPPNEDCDLIGAWPVACSLTATAPSSWSVVKTLY